MDEVLQVALGPVLADLRSTGAPVPRVQPSGWTEDEALPAAMLWSPDGSGVGIFVRAHDPEVSRVAHAAEQVQEWVVEERPGGDSTWPVCPLHPGTHPLSPVVVDGVARWVCARDRAVVARLGDLAGGY